MDLKKLYEEFYESMRRQRRLDGASRGALCTDKFSATLDITDDESFIRNKLADDAENEESEIVIFDRDANVDDIVLFDARESTAPTNQIQDPTMHVAETNDDKLKIHGVTENSSSTDPKLFELFGATTTDSSTDPKFKISGVTETASSTDPKFKISGVTKTASSTDPKDPIFRMKKNKNRFFDSLIDRLAQDTTMMNLVCQSMERDRVTSDDWSMSSYDSDDYD